MLSERNIERLFSLIEDIRREIEEIRKGVYGCNEQAKGGENGAGN